MLAAKVLAAKVLAAKKLLFTEKMILVLAENHLSSGKVKISSLQAAKGLVILFE